MIEQAIEVVKQHLHNSDRYELTLHNGNKATCRLCQQSDRWRKENKKVWVCEHEPPYPNFPLRYLDSVKHSDIMLCRKVLN